VAFLTGGLIRHPCARSAPEGGAAVRRRAWCKRAASRQPHPEL